MPTLDHVTLSPLRKRAVSDADLKPYNVLATPPSRPRFHGTPDADDVPGLGWFATPESPDRSPRTPSDASTPSKAPAADTDKDALSTPTTLCKEPRRSDRIKARMKSKPLKASFTKSIPSDVGSSAHKPSKLFQSFLYPVLPAEDTIKFDLVKDGSGQQGFKFSDMSRTSHGYNLRSSPLTQASAARLARKPLEDRAFVSKRVKQEFSSTAKAADRDLDKATTIECSCLDTPNDTQLMQVTVKSESESRATLVRQNSTTSGRETQRLGGSAFPRDLWETLPLEVIERVIEKPNKCASTLYTKPNKRCARPLELDQDNKVWLLERISNLQVSENLVAAESYLRELVDMVTCTQYHRKGATKRLRSLLDQFGAIGPQSTKATSGAKLGNDEVKDSIPRWLEALTRPPNAQKNGLQATPPHESTSAQGSVPTAANIPEPVSSVASEANRIVEVIQNAAAECGQVESTNTVRTTYTTNTIEVKTLVRDGAGTLQSSKTEKAVKETATIEVSHQRQTAPNERVSHIVTAKPAPKTTETTQTIQASPAAVPGAVAPLSTTTEIKRTFGWTQDTIININWWGKIADSTPQRPIVAIRQQIIQTLNQKFEPYHPAGSRGHSVEGWMRKCLKTPINEEKKDEGLTEASKFERRIGFIYMYWVLGNFGMVKIGYTTSKSTKTRLNDWRRQCGHEIDEHTRGEAKAADRLPLVSRVETLIHAELNAYRKREKECKKCSEGKTRERGKPSTCSHIEWFCISPDDAQKVIKKWSDWMLTNPYEKRGKQWCLKATITDDEIDKLCTPIEFSAQYKASQPALRRHSQPDGLAKSAKGRTKSL